MVADEEELATMLDRLPFRDLVRHQVAVALAVERSLETEDPPSLRRAATAVMVVPQERGSGSADEGPCFAQPALSARHRFCSPRRREQPGP